MIALAKNLSLPDEDGLDPLAAAESAGLRYVLDTEPGLRRRPFRKRFVYLDVDDFEIRDVSTLSRIESLVIPPAWEDVWICRHAAGHLQATGRDARRRKQYRYHARWREVRDQTKFARMIEFGLTLPTIRAAVETDLARRGLPREKVLATVVRLLETTLIRVGNEEYARTNRSYGLSTLRDKHVEVAGATIRFEFRGKSGVERNIHLRDQRLARIVKRCQDLPGQELFQFVDEHGEQQRIDSADVNAYIRGICGEYFTAKDFRTWAGTVLAGQLFMGFRRDDTHQPSQRRVAEVVKAVSQRLGNTPAVCRKCYIHPAVIENYLTVDAPVALSKSRIRLPHGLSEEEEQVLRLLIQLVRLAPLESRL